VEFHSTNPGQSIHFFNQMFGWTSFEENGYYQLSKNDTLVAGLVHRDESTAEQFASTTTNTTVYFAVNNADEMNEKIKQHGGTVLKEPHDVMEKGRMGIYKDTQGAVFGTWEAKTHKGIPVLANEKQHGLPCWFEVNTRNLDSTRNFYCDVFGLDTCTKNIQGTEYCYFFKGDECIGGCILMTEAWGDLPSHWLVYIYSDNVDSSAEKAKELGGNVNIIPTDLENIYKYTMVNDPGKLSISLLGILKKEMPELSEENERLMKENLLLSMKLNKQGKRATDNTDKNVESINITDDEKVSEMKDLDDTGKANNAQKRKREEGEEVDPKKRKLN